MRILYFLRVVIVGFEFLILLLMAGCLLHFVHQVEMLVGMVRLNDEFKKFLILLPVTIFVWIVKEARDFVFLESEFAAALVNWPDYEKFKLHVYVSLAYAVIFLLVSITPWVSKYDLLDGVGAVLFVGGVLGNFWVAGSIYFSQISMKEIFRIEHN
jgi:hypothetical protein